MLFRKVPPLVRYTQPTDGRRPMMDHQISGYQKMMTRDNPALLMEMRLGKCITSIRWAQDVHLHRKKLQGRPARRMLVACPLTVMEAWERELTLEGETFVRGYEISAAQRLARVEEVDHTPVGERKWLLINHDSLISMCDSQELKKYRERKKLKQPCRHPMPRIAYLGWDVFIFDESVKIKNPQAHITKICHDGFGDFKHRCTLTGLASPEGELDLFEQFYFLDRIFMGCRNYYEFRERYFEVGYDQVSWEPKLLADSAIKKEVHNIAFVLRREDAGIGSKKFYKEIRVNPTATQKKMIKQLQKEWAVDVISDDYVTTMGEVRVALPEMFPEEDQEKFSELFTTKEALYAITLMAWENMIACGIDPQGNWIGTDKVNEVIRLLKSDFKGQQVVLWFKYVNSLKAFNHLLKQAGFRTGVITGEVPQRSVRRDSRASILEAFRNKQLDLILATEKTAKYGVDCSTADAAFYVENEWSADDRGQSEDRIIHPTKKTPLLYVDFMTRGTVEEHLVELVKDIKLENARQFMTRFKRFGEGRYKRV